MFILFHQIFLRKFYERTTFFTHFYDYWGFRNAPNLICICTPANGGGELDAGLLGENIMLAAQSMGLGTCCLGGPVRFLLSNEKCKFFLDRLDIPADYKLNYIIAIGYPDEQPDAKPRDASKVKYIK